ncbi:MAG: T9SS type A sorting domain-containing protein [Aureispira sp.]|nr:T9SS type A sorting domain-containing protein [Aureispira sp.]
MRIVIWIALLSLYSNWMQAQFAPPAGQAGTTAIHKDSSIFVAWATKAIVDSGYVDISDTTQGKVKASMTLNNATAKSDGWAVSLGDGGSATLTFENPIQNGVGPDFAVFENAFNNTFLELGLVEVSSDGHRFVRFAAISNTDTSTQVNGFGSVDATKVYNLAGKYSAGYGTPFDLEELKDSVGLDVDAVTHVRVIDVVGCIEDRFATRDSRGVIINDPWKTAFQTGGFDLDAVGVIHQDTSTSLIGVKAIASQQSLKVYPNPIQVNNFLELEINTAVQNWTAQLLTIAGKPIQIWHDEKSLYIRDLPQGYYLMKVQTKDQNYIQKILILE